MKAIQKLFLFLIFSTICCAPVFSFAQSAGYMLHVLAASRHGVQPIKNNTHLKNYVSRKKLTSVSAGRGYTIHKLTHSKPYLVPKANRILKELGAQFYKKSNKNTFTITSLTRTISDQNRLTRVNNNATRTLSAHNLGSAFDISYIRFNRKKRSNPRLEKTLQSLLLQYQKSGKIYFIKERREKCFHVTVR